MAEGEKIRREREARAALEGYLQGIHHGDLAALERVLHPRLRLFGEAQGAPYEKSRAEYLAVVQARVAPAARGEPFRSRILAVELMGDIAAAKVFTAIGQIEYLDFLTLVRGEDVYQIVGKTFTDRIEQPLSDRAP